MATKLIVEIDCSTSPFLEPNGTPHPEAELAYILMRFVANLTTWGRLNPSHVVPLRSSVGATVGSAKLITED